MSELQIAWLELIIVGGLGVILSLSGVISNIIVKRQNKSCTKQTEGIVIQYGFPGDGRMYPIVEYSVNGTCYKAKKKFCGVKRISISGFPIKVQSEAYENEKGWLLRKLYLYNVRFSGYGNNNSQCIGILFDTAIIRKS